MAVHRYVSLSQARPWKSPVLDADVCYSFWQWSWGHPNLHQLWCEREINIYSISQWDVEYWDSQCVQLPVIMMPPYRLLWHNRLFAGMEDTQKGPMLTISKSPQTFFHSFSTLWEGMWTVPEEAEPPNLWNFGYTHLSLIKPYVLIFAIRTDEHIYLAIGANGLHRTD